MDRPSNMGHRYDQYSRLPGANGVFSQHQLQQQQQPHPQLLQSQSQPPSSNPIMRPVDLSHGRNAVDSLTYSFSIPSPTLVGPEKNIAFSTSGAKGRWLHPQSAVSSPTPLPVHKLPIHQQTIENLKDVCNSISDSSALNVKAEVHVADPMPSSANPKKGPVTTVFLYGEPDAVLRGRGIIFDRTPVKMKCATVDIDFDQVIGEDDVFLPDTAQRLETIATYCGVDIFVVHHEPTKGVPAVPLNGSDTSQDTRLKIMIFGDPESVDFAKTRVLVMIDEMLGLYVDSIFLELSLQNLMCGRMRRNLQHIEAVTQTNIYLPSPFPGLLGYKPTHASKRHPDLIFISGRQEQIQKAIQLINELVLNLEVYVKEVSVPMQKLDFIIQERLDLVKKIMAENGSFVQLPPLGAGRAVMRVQATEVLPLERTVKAILNHATQYYNAACWIVRSEIGLGVNVPSSPREIQPFISDIVAASGVEVSYTKSSFDFLGSDDAVKAALKIVSESFFKHNPCQIRVKLQLANEHKEFVSGKKNGKINKIMGQADVQILFEPFNEYDFYIDIFGSDYGATKLGLGLVEQELPASISFYVPDRYHKRIIGIGGTHIQRIMKKYSVFVKFSNAMDRDAAGSKDMEETVVDNVICKTPARNAANLELVKQEINNMVQQADAEYVEETVVIPRLFHRILIAQSDVIQSIEKRWSCKIRFPSTEMASDIVTITGPEWQVPHAMHAFLAHVPEHHIIEIESSEKVHEAITNPDFQKSVVNATREKFGVVVQILSRPKRQSQSHSKDVIAIQFTYTRDNRAYRDIAIEHLKSYLSSYGIIPEIRGAPSRPHSDSFEDSLPFFNSKLLPSISDGNTFDMRSESSKDNLQSSRLSDSTTSFGPQSAWENFKPVRPSSVSDEQRDRMLAELPEYLRGEYLRQSNFSSVRAGDRHAIYADGAPSDYDAGSSSFSRAVGTRPRSEVTGYTLHISPSKRYSGDSGTYSSSSSVWEQPISRPSTSGGRSDSWANGGAVRQDADPRKAWNSGFNNEKRIGAF